MRSVTKVLGAAALLVAGSGVGSAAQTDTGVAAATRFPQEQVQRYAAAMAAIERLNQRVATREVALPEAQRPALAQQADEERLGILQRYALDPATFNAMSKAVEADPALRERVRQALMDNLLGT